MKTEQPDLLAGTTPGPWIIRRDTIGIGDERGMQKHIAHMAWVDEQGKADARLIAAAPDLARENAELKARVKALESGLAMSTAELERVRKPLIDAKHHRLAASLGSQCDFNRSLLKGEA